MLGKLMGRKSDTRSTLRVVPAIEETLVRLKGSVTEKDQQLKDALEAHERTRADLLALANSARHHATSIANAAVVSCDTLQTQVASIMQHRAWSMRQTRLIR